MNFSKLFVKCAPSFCFFLISDCVMTNIGKLKKYFTHKLVGIFRFRGTFADKTLKNSSQISLFMNNIAIKVELCRTHTYLGLTFSKSCMWYEHNTIKPKRESRKICSYCMALCSIFNPIFTILKKQLVFGRLIFVHFFLCFSLVTVSWQISFDSGILR